MNGSTSDNCKNGKGKQNHVVYFVKFCNNFCAFLVKTKNDFKYGNYRNYYFKRLGAGCNQQDIRLELMKSHPEYFKDKQILDIGCNSGFVTINLAKSLHPKSILGIDIDGNLIDAARKNLQRQKTDFSLSEQEMISLSKVIFRKVGLD